VTLAVDKVKEVEAAIAAANAKPSEAEKIQSFAGLAGPAGDAVKASENARAAAIASIGSVTKSPGDWGPVKANAAVAGGAAVLAALFGWGIIHYSPGIKQVFSLEDHYERVFISACAAYKAVCSLDELPKDSALSEFTLSDYDISIYMDSGTPIPFIREDRRIRLVLLSEDTRNSSFFWLKIKRSKNGEGTEFRKELTLPVKLGTKERGSSNCASFEGTSGQSCPLAALSLEGQVANEDRARVKVYSLNFFGERDQTGLVKTQAKVLPDEKGGLKSGVGAIPLDFDLSVKSGSAAQ
jgi:hypothetical protein